MVAPLHIPLLMLPPFQILGFASKIYQQVCRHLHSSDEVARFCLISFFFYSTCIDHGQYPYMLNVGQKFRCCKGFDFKNKQFTHIRPLSYAFLQIAFLVVKVDHRYIFSQI